MSAERLPAGLNTGPLIEVEDVSLSLGGKTILSGASVAVQAGEIVTLIGPNGAGKTSLVRVAIGLAEAESGRVRRSPGLVIGYLPQRLEIDPVLPLSVERFLTLTRRHDPTTLGAALAEVGCAAIAGRQVRALSGGELRRLLLARALLRDPDLLILDEPLAGVDFAGQAALFALIDRVRERRGCGVLLVSHDLHLVMAGTDRVVCLNRHVCCTGAPETVSQDPAYLELFGPAAAGHFAVYTHRHDHHHDLAGQPVAGGSGATGQAKETGANAGAAAGGKDTGGQA